MRKDLNYALDVSALVLLLLFFLIVLVQFFTAMSSGGELLVAVNDHGEMWLEATVLPLVLIFLVWRLSIIRRKIKP